MSHLAPLFRAAMGKADIVVEVVDVEIAKDDAALAGEPGAILHSRFAVAIRQTSFARRRDKVSVDNGDDRLSRRRGASVGRADLQHLCPVPIAGPHARRVQVVQHVHVFLANRANCKTARAAVAAAAAASAAPAAAAATGPAPAPCGNRGFAAAAAPSAAPAAAATGPAPAAYGNRGFAANTSGAPSTAIDYRLQLGAAGAAGAAAAAAAAAATATAAAAVALAVAAAAAY